MKNNRLNLIKIGLPFLLAAVALNFSRGQDEIHIQKQSTFSARPSPFRFRSKASAAKSRKF